MKHEIAFQIERRIVREQARLNKKQESNSTGKSKNKASGYIF